ncbi:glycosyltransferase [Nitrosomonas sp.]|uniref:glycosyltransferase n=1 Tax=Nitrosomonas sp. TaxID=42353 RepID=UPI0025D878D7|nr:glycosyltransferase [Nitrosomonas sp.]MCC6915927.1 glycosyltransferase [Nitrosomonas sp.]
MHISFIIPAFNEAQLIEPCLRSIADAVAVNQSYGYTHEVIVVDNNSTDNTAQLAAQSGARVVFEPVNHIARARTAGANAAEGEWLVFMDADCLMNAGLVTDIFELIKQGKHIGAGSTLRMPGQPWWAEILLRIWTLLSVLLGWAAGALIVCNTTAFREVEGFDLTLYAAEEIELSRKLKQYGRKRKLKFTILSTHPLETSSRKTRLYSGWEIFGQFVRLALSPLGSLRNKKKLPMWYDGRR